MCRSLKVLCVAEDRETLAALKRASASAEWELTSGATDAPTALEQLEAEKPHVLVVFGSRFAELVAAARGRSPGLRIVTDRESRHGNAAVASVDEVRAAVKGLPRPAGPVRT